MPRQSTEQTTFARQLRREPTQFERTLWKLLRDHQLDGYHFRRQHPVGPYVADFACIKAKLIVELDGNTHDERIEYDAQRDAALQAMGWRCCGFPIFISGTILMSFGIVLNGSCCKRFKGILEW